MVYNCLKQAFYFAYTPIGSIPFQVLALLDLSAYKG